MLSDGLKSMVLTDRQQGEIKLLIPIPHPPDPWGSLAVLRGTAWEDQITVVAGSVMADAFHGHATPLMRIIGREPRYRALMIPEGDGLCSLVKQCAMSSDHCRVGRKKLPECFEAPLTDPQASHMAALVALAWKEDRYVVVVDGDGWNLM